VRRRDALIIESRGERFRFYYDLRIPAVLHITYQHGTTPEDAIQVYFEAESHIWDEVHVRFQISRRLMAFTGPGILVISR
jgi:hypothetical protein